MNRAILMNYNTGEESKAKIRGTSVRDLKSLFIRKLEGMDDPILLFAWAYACLSMTLTKVETVEGASNSLIFETDYIPPEDREIPPSKLASDDPDLSFDVMGES